MLFDVAFCLLDEREHCLKRPVIALGPKRPRCRFFVSIKVCFENREIEIAAFAPYRKIPCVRVKVFFNKRNKFADNITGEITSAECLAARFFVLLSPPSNRFGIIVKAFRLALVVGNTRVEIDF